jgi:hypothetical protein
MKPNNEELVIACIELMQICESKSEEERIAEILILSSPGSPKERVNLWSFYG